MATRYSKEKYAHIRGMKNEPLSSLAMDSKKQKLGDEKGDTVVPPSIQTASSSPTPSFEVTTFTSSTTHSKGKGKVGKSIWDDPATALGRAHNVVIDDDYLNTEEKVVVANSKLESIEAENSKLRKDLIVAMDETNKANEKIKELNKALRVEKMLVVHKDEEI